VPSGGDGRKRRIFGRLTSLRQWSRS
jgi:hypothetical protein